MALDEADDHIDVAQAKRVGFFQHAVGLAHARRKPDV